jgi:signal transduction histidine kinase
MSYDELMDFSSTAPIGRAAAGLAGGREHRIELGRAGVSIAGWGAVLLALVFVPAAQFALPGWLNVSLHTLFETVSIVVSALVFSVGWHTFSRERSSSVALICNAFFAIAILDFVHMLSFEGMPALITPSGGGKAIPTFLAARLLAALALLGIALLPWQKRIGPASRNWLLALCLAFALAVSISSLADVELKRLFLVPGVGLTPLKIGIEYLVIGLNIAAAAGFVMRMRDPQPYQVSALFTAACMAALSELCFTLYSRTVDHYNVLGHVYKVIAYLLIYRALFVTLIQNPYLQLESAQRDLQDSEGRYRMLSKAQSEVLRLNASLEQRVQQRTAQLAAANEELERFAYSVAHDLRSPLAAISGFSRAMEKVLPTAADERQQHYLGRILAGVARMDEMIEALLELAHVSRGELVVETLDLTQIAHQILSSRRELDPARAVRCSVQERLMIHGDRGLMTILMDNLIGNAWKFTSQLAEAEILVGSEWVDGELVCFVKDNGAGFDMAYAAKLFGVFQRLHSQSEFPGHGIGLANVRRIVARHNGRVWAESAPGQGATFRFTLGAAVEATAPA